MLDTELWQLGVFRPLLHRVAADAYQLHVQGVDVRFSRCGLPTKPTGDTTALDATAAFCRDCLINAEGFNELISVTFRHS